MSTWHHFPMWTDRNVDAYVFGPDERDRLELTIADQTATLLAEFGTMRERELDLSGSIYLGEITTFQTVELDDVVLEDDSELQVHQLPLRKDTWITDKGAYGITKEDDEGYRVLELTVYDPSLNITPPVIDVQGERVDQDILQELYEALGSLILDLGATEVPNKPPLLPETYPQLMPYEAFEEVIKDLKL